MEKMRKISPLQYFIRKYLLEKISLFNSVSHALISSLTQSLSSRENKTTTQVLISNIYDNFFQLTKNVSFHQKKKKEKKMSFMSVILCELKLSLFFLHSFHLKLHLNELLAKNAMILLI